MTNNYSTYKPVNNNSINRNNFLPKNRVNFYVLCFKRKNRSIICVALLCIGLYSCATKGLYKKYDAKNEKKLARVYIVEDGDEKLEFEKEQSWLEYCDSQNPWGYSILKEGTKSFTGMVLRIYKKNKFSKPSGYAVFTYKNGFIDGHYSYHLINGDTLIDGLSAVDKTVPWGDGMNRPICPLLNGGLDLRELDRHRREYVVREQIFNSSGRLVSFYVRDSLYMNISEIHDSTIKEWEEISYNHYGKFHYNLRTTQNGDTLYYRYNSDSASIIIDASINTSFYNGSNLYSFEDDLRYFPSNRFYSNHENSFGISLTGIASWDPVQGIIHRKTYKDEVITTFSGDTLERVNLFNGKYHGNLCRFSPGGDTVEIIPFDNGNLNGNWVKLNSNGDTIFFRSYTNGQAHGQSFGLFYLPQRSLPDYVEESFENGFINGKVRIYKYFELSDTNTFLQFKQNKNDYLKYEFSMKDGVKHGVYMKYNDRHPSDSVNKNKNIRDERISYFEGIKHGEYQNYRRNGDLAEVGNYEYEKKNGIWKSYYDDSTREWKNYPVKGVLYKNDKPLKIFRYDSNGTVLSEKDL